MATPAEMRLSDLREKYLERPDSPRYTRLYENEARFGHMFAVLHEQLNMHFESINGRAKTTHHYWADPSRALLALIEDVRDDLYDLSLAGVDVTLHPAYEQLLEDLKTWLSPSGGSPVPDDFQLINVIKHEPVFVVADGTVRLDQLPTAADLKMVGSGSYANVFSYIDPNYGTRFAIKRAKRDISARDLERFRKEFEVLSSMHFPYIVEVYKFDADRNEYRMEFCDETLRTYIAKRNAKLSFPSRKRIALQFLYGMNFVHSLGHLHRDISLQNVLVKVFAKEAVLVKLSDFGLVKTEDSTFTRTGSEMRGTIRDPALHDFKRYDLVNEMYPIGWVLSYIFTGRESLIAGSSELAQIILGCTSLETDRRYGSVREVIAAVESLPASPTQASA